MPKKMMLCLVGAMAAAMLAHVAPAAGLTPVRLDAQALSAGQIRTARLKRLESAPRVSAYGIVLDPGPLVTLASQVIAARGAATAARAKSALARSEARRATRLYRAHHNVSQAALQSAQSSLQIAEAEQATAAAKLVQLQTRMLAHWGPELSAAALSSRAPLPGLEKGAAALVEVSLPLGQALGNPPTEAPASTPDGETVRLRFIGRAPRAATGVAGQSLFYLMPAQTSAPIGTPLAIALEDGATEAGVLVPRSAVVWHQGEALVFRETAPTSFAPVPIRGSFRSGDGYFVPESAGTPLHAGDRIVTGGAALLYSAATQAAPAAKAAWAGKADDGDDD